MCHIFFYPILLFALNRQFFICRYSNHNCLDKVPSPTLHNKMFIRSPICWMNIFVEWMLSREIWIIFANSKMQARLHEQPAWMFWFLIINHPTNYVVPCAILLYTLLLWFRRSLFKAAWFYIESLFQFLFQPYDIIS